MQHYRTRHNIRYPKKWLETPESREILRRHIREEPRTKGTSRKPDPPKSPPLAPQVDGA
jgi:hypothetical protein